MNKNRNRLIFILVASIFVIFAAFSTFGYQDYALLIEGLSIENAELSAENILIGLEHELTKPVYVSRLISNTIALNELSSTDILCEDISACLKDVQDEYGYSTAFFINTNTNNLYKSDGFNSTIDTALSENDWINEFINNNSVYELHLARRPNLEKEVMLYVSYAVKDENRLIGIAGVGISLNNIREILADYSEDFEGSAYLVNTNGTIQINSGPHPSTPVSYQFLKNQEKEIYNEFEEDNIFISEVDGNDVIFSFYYIEEIDVYLVMNQDYDILDFLLVYQKIRTIVVFVIAFLLLAILIIKITSHFHKKNIKLVNTDYLTEIFNRNAFDESLKEAVSFVKEKDSEITLAIIDVDDFKRINDVHGHIEGDKILKSTANHFNTFIRDKDIVARWGGDEFAVIFRCDLEHTKRILSRIKESVQENSILSKYGVTFSIGITQCNKDDDIKSLLKRADEALYSAKDQGKDRICEI